MFADPKGCDFHRRARPREGVVSYGRFLEPDPIGYEAGLNLFAYVGNDPVNASDPSGMLVQYCTGSILPSSDGCAGVNFLRSMVRILRLRQWPEISQHKMRSRTFSTNASAKKYAVVLRQKTTNELQMSCKELWQIKTF